MWEKELRSIEESQDFANQRSIVSEWRKESDWAPLLPVQIYQICTQQAFFWHT